MVEGSITEVVTTYGGLGLLALFAWILLKSVLKQQEKLTQLLDNHLTTLLQRAEKTNQILEHLCERLKEIK